MKPLQIVQLLLLLVAVAFSGLALHDVRLLKAPSSGPLGAVAYVGALSITDWYVDPQNTTTCASDANTGTSATCASGGVGPLLSFGQITARWGTNQPVLGGVATSNSLFVTVHALSAWSTTSAADALNVDPKGGLLFIQGPLGTVNQVTSGTLASVVAKNPATAQPLTATLAAGIALGEIIHNTTHDSYAWPNRNTSGNTWIITQPMSQFGAAEVDTWANGDAYTVYTPIYLAINNLGFLTETEFVTTKYPTTSGDNIVSSIFYAEDSIQGVPPAGSPNPLDGAPSLVNCDFTTTTVLPAGTVLNAGQWRGTNALEGALVVENDWMNQGSGNGVFLFDNAVIHSMWSQNPTNPLVISGSVTVFNYIAGTQLLFIQPPGQLLHQSNITAASIFLSTNAHPIAFGTLTGVTTGCALDSSVDPALLHCGRSLTGALLDATVASGGFGGTALGVNGGRISTY